MEAVDLTPDTTNATTETTPGTTEEGEETVQDPWAVDESAAGPGDGEVPPEDGMPKTDTEEAIHKLKVSGARLGTAVKDTTVDIDKTFGISNVLSSFGTKVKEVDDKTQVSGHVTSVVKNASSVIGALLSNVDDRLQISTKSKEIGGTLGSSVSAVLGSDPVQKTATAVKDFDETHGVTRSTASTLAVGADMLANVLGGGSDDSAAGANAAAAASSDSLKFTATVDAVEKKDADGVPSSFEK